MPGLSITVIASQAVDYLRGCSLLAGLALLDKCFPNVKNNCVRFCASLSLGFLVYPSKKAKKVRSPACTSLYHVTASSRADQCDSVTAHVTISCEGEANGILRDARPSVVGPYARPRRTREDAARAPARTFSLFLFNALESQDANGRTVRDSEDGRGRKGCARSTRTYGAHGYGGGEEAETRCSACNRGRLGFGTSELGRKRFTYHVCLCTVRDGRMSPWKWRSTKQHPSRARSGNHISCCLFSLHFLCDILP